MMNALRMVWIISRHFNRDDQMVPLMERIAWQLAQKVQATLNIKFLFKNRSPQTLGTVKQVWNAVAIRGASSINTSVNS